MFLQSLRNSLSPFRIFPPEALPSGEKRVREKKEKDLIHFKNEKNHGEL